MNKTIIDFFRLETSAVQQIVRKCNPSIRKASLISSRQLIGTYSTAGNYGIKRINTLKSNSLIRLK